MTRHQHKDKTGGVGNTFWGIINRYGSVPRAFLRSGRCLGAKPDVPELTSLWLLFEAKAIKQKQGSKPCFLLLWVPSRTRTDDIQNHNLTL